MDTRSQIPMGQAIPADNPHAVSVSLPSLQDVIDYEENVPEALDAMEAGYPRFFQNRLVQRLVAHVKNVHNISEDRELIPLPSRRSVEIINAMLGQELKYMIYDDLYYLEIDRSDALKSDVTRFVQNYGLVVSSRQAETLLEEYGLLDEIYEEEHVIEDAAIKIKNVLSEAYETESCHIRLVNSGTNAVYASIQAMMDLHRATPKKIVVQLGWLYLDTQQIIEKSTEAYHVQIDLSDKNTFEAWIEKNHLETACVVTEIVTNPLIQCVDLPWLYGLCSKYDIPLIADATIITPYNAYILDYCDVAVESLTKFACGHADVLSGAVITKTDWHRHADFLEGLSAYSIPLYMRDAQRLAWEIDGYKARVKDIATRSQELLHLFENSPVIKKVHSIRTDASWEAFCKIRRDASSFVGLMSIVFDGDLATYYDALPYFKGPSLGTEFTLLMPYVYLAHYDMLLTEEGIHHLREHGLDPGLLRVSVGLEDALVFKEALERL